MIWGQADSSGRAERCALPWTALVGTASSECHNTHLYRRDVGVYCSDAIGPEFVIGAFVPWV